MLGADVGVGASHSQQRRVTQQQVVVSRTHLRSWSSDLSCALVADVSSRAVSKGLRTALYALITVGLLISWLIALSGVSALQKICHNPGFGGCRRGLGLAWWVVWFEFLTIIITLAVQVGTLPTNLSPGQVWTCSY